MKNCSWCVWKRKSAHACSLSVLKWHKTNFQSFFYLKKKICFSFGWKQKVEINPELKIWFCGYFLGLSLLLGFNKILPQPITSHADARSNVCDDFDVHNRVDAWNSTIYIGSGFSFKMSIGFRIQMVAQKNAANCLPPVSESERKTFLCQMKQSWRKINFQKTNILVWKSIRQWQTIS